jgi:hypothetical protein
MKLRITLKLLLNWNAKLDNTEWMGSGVPHINEFEYMIFVFGKNRRHRNAPLRSHIKANAY